MMTSEAPFCFAIKGKPAAGQTTNLLLGFALCEATGLFGLVVALIILFG